jgi:hypothetical protein
MRDLRNRSELDGEAGLDATVFDCGGTVARVISAWPSSLARLCDQVHVALSPRERLISGGSTWTHGPLRRVPQASRFVIS